MNRNIIYEYCNILIINVLYCCISVVKVLYFCCISVVFWHFVVFLFSKCPESTTKHLVVHKNTTENRVQYFDYQYIKKLCCVCCAVVLKNTYVILK